MKSKLNGQQSSSKQQTLFAIPEPVIRHSHFLPHGHRAFRRRRRRRSLQSGGEGEEGEGSTVDVSTTDYETGNETESNSDDEGGDVNQKKPPSKQKFPRRFRETRSTVRERHLQHIYDLMMLSISRGDSKRSFRCLRILLHAHEWDPVELWRYALQITTMIAADEGVTVYHHQQVLEEELISKRRLAFMRQLNKSRASALQVDLLLEMIPEMLMLGLEEQAMEEIDVVLNTYPFRLEPLLHLYSAMIYLIVCEKSFQANDEQDEEQNVEIKFGSDVSLLDKELAYIPKQLLIAAKQNKDENALFQVQKIEQKFEMVLTVGLAISKRGRRDVRSQSQSRSASRSRSQSRSASRSRSQSRSTTGRNRSDVSGSESETSRRGSIQQQRRKRRRGRRSDVEEDDEENNIDFTPILTANVERDDIRVMNDGWARAMARAYLSILQSPITIIRNYGELDDE